MVPIFLQVWACPDRYGHRTMFKTLVGQMKTSQNSDEKTKSTETIEEGALLSCWFKGNP